MLGIKCDSASHNKIFYTFFPLFLLFLLFSYKFCRLDGTTPTHLRLPMVQSFNSTPETSIFLLSTKAGGVGLNLTGANVVIIYDPSWNPANDMQAQDRYVTIEGL